LRWVRLVIFRSCAGALRAAPLFAAAIAFGAAAPDPLADLKSGAAAVDSKRYPAAIAALDGLGQRLPKLADYAAWLLGSAQFELKDSAGAIKSLEPVWSQTPASPLTPRAAVLAARAYQANGEAPGAVEILRKYYSLLPQPSGDLELANAFYAAGDKVSAAAYYQRVYYGYPLSSEAASAQSGLALARTELGSEYPPAMPNTMLGRAFRLLEGGQALRARTELESLIPKLGGAERDLARVRIGVAMYNMNQTANARKYLAALEVTSPDAAAERLHYLLQCARRLGDTAGMTAALDSLAKQYPKSPWRMQALIAAANQYLLENKIDAYEPLYRTCYVAFSTDPQAGICHWKYTWAHYLRRQPDAADLFREHVRQFPASEETPGALYFLGRISEAAGDSGSARAFYLEIDREYPNFYYASVARERLSAMGAGVPSAAAAAFLKSVAFPMRSRTQDFTPNPTTQARIDRSRLLAKAGLGDWAEAELRYGAQYENQPHVLAMELARLREPSQPAQALRYMKRYAGSGMFLPVDSAPFDFWRLIFPLPYRQEIERFSKDNGIDPFLVAGLIRQESEFDAKVVSRANARGLTQIEPSTGRQLSRMLKVGPYSTLSLFQPGMNLRLGTYYLKMLNTEVGGKVEAALAAYNAGLSRARTWLTWGDFREPSEFIETVPFSETRGYIQAVLRNADTYRRVYSDSKAGR
jgi:soluble lytic murein transglycosylase